MWEPVGPLPAHVYWRRRWAALACALSLFAVLGLAFGTLTASGRGSAETATTRAVNTSALVETAEAGLRQAAPSSVTATAGPAGAPPSMSVSGRTSGPGGTARVDASARGTGRAPGGAPASGALPGEQPLRPDDTPRPSIPAPGIRPSPPSGPPPCTNAMIDVTAEIDGAEHPVGSRPLLRLVVVDTSDQACVRDLGGALLEIVVWDPTITHRLWSSNDCVDPSTQDLRTLLPGQPVAFTVAWSGFTSNPGCTAPRTHVPAGEYRVMTRVADRISAPTAFRLV